MPNPDPTERTLESSLREIANLKEILSIRIDAVEKAAEKANQELTRVPTETDKQIARLKELMDQTFEGANKLADERFAAVGQETSEKIDHLKALHGEKFDSVAVQFKERDTRSERESRDNKVAVDAAFAAQKEAASEQNKSNTLAIDKSEKATAETLNKQADLFKSTTDALAGQIEDGKESANKLDTRLTALENRVLVTREGTQTSQWSSGFLLSIFVAVLSVAGLIIAVLVAMTRATIAP